MSGRKLPTASSQTEARTAKMPLFHRYAPDWRYSAARAAEYLQSGAYLWNSGIFAVRASVWLDAVGSFRPDIFTACERAYRQGKRDGGFLRIDPALFRDCPSDSIDY